MGHHKLFYQDAKTIRDALNAAIDLSLEIHEKEAILVERLKKIDQKRWYVRYGYKSLRGFCQQALKFSKTQSQRIATQVRRYEPTVEIMDEEGLGNRSEVL